MDYGSWVIDTSYCIPTWDMGKSMGYEGLWVMRGMDYEGVDCILKLRVHANA